MNHSEAMAELRAGKVRPVYLIYGGEPFLEQELYRAIRSAVVAPETADFNLNIFDPGPDQVARAISTAQTHPFFAERRLVVLRDCPAFSAARKSGADSEEEGEEKAAGGDELLLNYLKSPVASTCLVILSSENVDSRKKVTKAAIATGGAVECKPLKEQDAVMWAQARAQSMGKRLSDGAGRLLLEKLGTDLWMIDQELKKLALYVGEAKEIRTVDVDAAVGGVAETEVFRLTEAVMLKQRVRALELLARTLRQVDHPLQLLAALTSRFRQMLMVKALTARGTSLREGPGLAKMHPFAYEKMAGYVRAYSREELVAALARMLETDLAMKSGADPKLALETLVAELLS